MAKFRRATITSPSTANVVDFEFNQNDTFDRRSADTDLHGSPVKTKEQGSGSFTLCSGARPSLYDQDMTVVVQDVTVTAGSEVITSRTFTFHHVTLNGGVSANNDGGESSRKISFEFGNVEET